MAKSTAQKKSDKKKKASQRAPKRVRAPHDSSPVKDRRLRFRIPPRAASPFGVARMPSRLSLDEVFEFWTPFIEAARAPRLRDD